MLYKQILPKTIEYLQIFIQVHYNQIFAWYWGVFGWLEKTLPLTVYPVLKIATIFSVIGLLKVWRRVKFFVLVVFLQALIVIANDWLIFVTTGQIYGIQGRYFLPAIGPQIILMVFGLFNLWPKSQKLFSLILIGLSFGLNLIGLNSLYQYFGFVWR